jgi:hypothetical protein
LTRDELKKRIDTVEESYEFFLAYAAQGLTGQGTSGSEVQVRDFLRRTDEALSGLGPGFTAFVERERLAPPAPYRAMIDVLERDATDTRAAVQLVLAQTAISSQLIDNLNASIHVRALLTDLFLLDEILKEESAPRPP